MTVITAKIMVMPGRVTLNGSFISASLYILRSFCPAWFGHASLSRCKKWPRQTSRTCRTQWQPQRLPRSSGFTIYVTASGSFNRPVPRLEMVARLEVKILLRKRPHQKSVYFCVFLIGKDIVQFEDVWILTLVASVSGTNSLDKCSCTYAKCWWTFERAKRGVNSPVPAVRFVRRFGLALPHFVVKALSSPAGGRRAQQWHCHGRVEVVCRVERVLV